jgi:hypothetical protein
MKTLLSLLFALTVSSALADTYTLYLVRGSAKLFDGAKDQELLTRIYSNDAVIEVMVETDGTSQKGTNQTHAIDYIQEWDAAGNPKSRASRDVGSKFRVQEKKDDLITYEFSHTRLERWIPISPPKPLLQPVFTSQDTNSQLALKKGSLVVVGGLSAEEIHDGVPRKIMRYIVIERK